MRYKNSLFIFLLALTAISCVPVEKLAFHDLSTGYYRLKTPGQEDKNVYIDVMEDSLTIYPAVTNKTRSIDTSTFRTCRIGDIRSGDYLFGSSMVKKSVDIDLNTILLKYRPARGEVPNQLSANINASVYIGFRRDFFRMVTTRSPLNQESTYSRHLGFDFGLFAGLGITQINPTVTADAIDLEYDGVIFQKGAGAFLTFERMSAGIVIGFDNLLDNNKSVWLYNQKPYLGFSIGIANF